MARHRGRMEMIATMLRVADGGVLKTKLMYNAYMSYTQLTEYLELLQVRGLIEFKEKQWFTTGKGKEFLKKYVGISIIE